MTEKNNNLQPFFVPDPNMKIGPMVYFGTYPMPLEQWMQNMQEMPQAPPVSGVERQFSLPFPEDDID